MRGFFTGKMLLLAFMLFCTLPSLPGWSAEGGYLGILGGANLLQNEHERHHKIAYKTGYAAAINGGFGFCNNVRVEAEFFYRRNEIKAFRDGGHKVRCGYRQSLSLMANCLYDFDFCYPVIPYLGGGIGADYSTLNIHFPEDRLYKRSASGALQAIAGLSAFFADRVEVCVDYRCNWSFRNLTNNTFMLTVKLYFP